MNTVNLGALEQTIMHYLWEHNGGAALTVRDVLAGINAETTPGYAYNTILTVMTHLYDKGLLRRTKHGKVCLYSVAMSKDQFVAHTSRSFFNRMRKEYGSLALAHFASLLDTVDPRLLKKAQHELKRR